MTMTDFERLNRLAQWADEHTLNIAVSRLDDHVEVWLVETEDDGALLGRGHDIRTAIDSMPKCVADGEEFWEE